MSNNNNLLLHSTLNLNKLYSYSNPKLAYLYYHVNFTVLPHHFSLHYTGIYPSLSNQLTLINVLNQLLPKKITPFLFYKQSKNTQPLLLKSNHLSHFRYLTKLPHKQFTSVTSTKPLRYTYHNLFLIYKNYFNDFGVPLFSPFIKKKPSSFSFISKIFTRKTLKTQRIKKKIFAHRKFWFIHTLLKLNKKIKIYNLSKGLNLRRFLKTIRLKDGQMLKRKNYLTPRQHLFLNVTRFSMKNKNSIKITMLRRIVHFYRRKLRRINRTSVRRRFTNKNLKYKLQLVKSKKRPLQFKVSSLKDLKFYNSHLNMQRTIRRGKSKSKLRRTKKYYSTFIRTINYKTKNNLVYSILRHYKLSKIRYLNRFFRQNIRRYKLHLLPILFSNQTVPFDRESNVTHTDFLTTLTSVYEYYPLSNITEYFTVSNNNSNTIFSLNNKFNSLFHSKFINKISKLSSPSIFSSILKNNPSQLTIYGKYKTPFILSTIGFIFIQNIYTQTSSYVKSRLNRFRYSFFFKKDLKRYLLKKSGKLKLLSSINVFTNYKTRVGRFGRPFIPSSFSNKLINLESNNSPISSTNLLTSQNPFFSYKYNRRYNKHLGSVFKTEARIKRIKFKPGYSRIWRSAREALNSSLNLNSRYQYRLTRHLHRIKNLSKQTQAYLHDLTLKNVLLNSHFVRDHQSAILFIQNGLTFVNGIQTFNPNLNLFQQDFIQIIVSLKYYIIFRWLLNWNAAKRIRLRKLSKTKFKKFKMMVNKQRSRNLPDWILTSRLKSFDIPKYLEVDFFTLSSFIVYEPFVSNDLNSVNFLESRSEIINMYNWKYIN